MSEEQFTKSLREFTQRKPFVPFVVEFLDGRRVIVEHPGVAFSGPAAGFIHETEGLVGFSCDEVRNMFLATAETAS